MIDSKSGNNMLYLPLDKLQGNAGATGSSSQEVRGAVASAMSNAADRANNVPTRSLRDATRESRQ